MVNVPVVAQQAAEALETAGMGDNVHETVFHSAKCLFFVTIALLQEMRDIHQEIERLHKTLQAK